MDESLHSDELLIRYLDNEMQPEERRQFELDLQADEVLRERLVALQLAIEALKQVGTAQKVKGIHTQMMEELTAHRKRAPVRNLIRRSLAIAASVILLVSMVSVWWFYDLSSENVYDAHYLAYRPTQTRSGSAGNSTLKTQYQNRNYSAVTDLAGSVSLTAEDSLLIGLSYLQTEQTQPAIRWFDALQSAGGNFSQDAEYYQAMAYIKDKDYDKALNALEKIRGNKQHLYHKQVTRVLLWKLRMLQWK